MKPCLMVVTWDDVEYFDDWREALLMAKASRGCVVSYASLEQLQKCGSHAQWQVVTIDSEYIENYNLDIPPLGF